MILFRGQQKPYCDGKVLLIGHGLIGSAIRNVLLKRKFNQIIRCEIDWKNVKTFTDQLLLIKNHLQNNEDSMDVVWAAGKAGFDACSEVMANEYAVFETIICRIVDLFSKQGIDLNFHFISSAGALFEGQTNVTRASEPTPQRPYAFLKIKQEEFFHHLINDNTTCNIYRLSTVFGYTQPGKRFGLISTMVYNAIKKRETIIDGNYNTMRDYIWVDNVADYIVRRLLKPDYSSNIVTLASCRPMNIFQIHKLIENTFDIRCMIRFVSKPSNFAHNTYSPIVLPSGFKSSPMILNIQKIYHYAIHCGIY